MPLTLAELDSIQADAMADDVEIDFEKMRLWTHEQAVVFFETGEEPPPPAVLARRAGRLRLSPCAVRW